MATEDSLFQKLKDRLQQEKPQDIGVVRHPRRLVKIIHKGSVRHLTVKDDGSIEDGPGTAYMKTIEDVTSLQRESDRKKRFQDKWVQFGFVEKDKWFVYDPDSARITKEERESQIKKFGAAGFVEVNENLVSRNEERMNAIAGVGSKYGVQEDALYDLLPLQESLLNCTFGYNYDQPANSINITVANNRGESKGLFNSGDFVVVYMWYDKPDDPSFTAAVKQWERNTDIRKENKLLNGKAEALNEGPGESKGGGSKLRQLSTKIADAMSGDTEFPENGILQKQFPQDLGPEFGVVRMFFGIIDNVNYEYSKQGGNKIQLQGRSFGYLLNSARIYKSYPTEGRLTMPHEEIIYDLVTQQTGLYISNIILDKMDFMVGLAPPKNKEGSSHVFGFDELSAPDATDEQANKTREELEKSAFDNYETAVSNAIRTGNIGVLGKQNIEGLVELDEKFAENTFDVVKKDVPAPTTNKYDINNEKSIDTAELGLGNTTPIWIYSDGKTGRNNHGGYPNTSIKTILTNQLKLRQKLPVELLPKYWSDYGIRVPQDEKRADKTTVQPVRLFFIDGWNATKYIFQERAVATSAARATKIMAILAANEVDRKWDELDHKVVEGDWAKKKYSGYEEGKLIFYVVPKKVGSKAYDPNDDSEAAAFNPIQLAIDLNVLTEDEVEKKEKETKNKQKDGSFKLIEQAIKNPRVNQDALNRLRLFYKTVRQVTRMVHDKINNGAKSRAVYPNGDSILVPKGDAKANRFAIDFPVARPGEIIVLPPHIANAPRTWYVTAKYSKTDDGWVVDLTTQIEKIYSDKTFTKEWDKGSSFDDIVPQSRRADDEMRATPPPQGGQTKELGVNLSKVGDWKVFFKKENGLPDNEDAVVYIQFSVTEDAKKLKELKQAGKDLVFKGETVFEAVKKITAKYFDIIQYVDEYKRYVVRPRSAEGVIGQVKRRSIKSASDDYPKYISGKIVENAAQTINRVVLKAESPGTSEVVIITVDDKESINKFGVKLTYKEVSKINDIVNALKEAKSVLLQARQKSTRIEVTCEPVFELRPGHRIDVYDISSGLSGTYIINTVGINFSKNGGAVQTFNAHASGDAYQTDDLEGRVAYLSKEGDTLKLRKQYSEKDIQAGKHNAQTSGA